MQRQDSKGDYADILRGAFYRAGTSRPGWCTNRKRRRTDVLSRLKRAAERLDHGAHFDDQRASTTGTFVTDAISARLIGADSCTPR